MPTFQASYLQEIAAKIFRGVGADEASARQVAEALVEADLAGHDSHGVIRIVEYVREIRAGRLKPGNHWTIVRETATTLQVNGHWGFGTVIARAAMERLIGKAKEHHIAAASVSQCGHVGRLGTYPTMAAEHGLIALAFANGGGAEPRVAPHGGRRAVFGTNPIAAAVPVAGSAPIVIDFSTAVVASGKIRVAKDRGETLPDGWILDREGKPSNRPQDYYDGGMLLPAAGHKGYALCLLAEVLGGLLSGAGSPIVPESGYQVGNGVFFLALSVEALQPLEIFSDQVRKLVQVIKASPPQHGLNEVLVPGEPERRARTRRLADGIVLADETWSAIRQSAAPLGLALRGTASES